MLLNHFFFILPVTVYLAVVIAWSGPCWKNWCAAATAAAAVATATARDSSRNKLL